MKKGEKEVQVTKYYFEAVDGTKFDYDNYDSSSERTAMNKCSEYEENLECVLLQRLGNKLKRVEQFDKDNSWKLSTMFSADEDSDIYLFIPTSEDDIKNLLMYVEKQGEWFFSSKKILADLKPNEKYLLINESDNGYFAIISRDILDNRIKEINNSFNIMTNPKEKEE